MCVDDIRFLQVHFTQILKTQIVILYLKVFRFANFDWNK